VVVCAVAFEENPMNTNRMHELIKHLIFCIVFSPLKNRKLEIKIAMFLLPLLVLYFQKLTLLIGCQSIG